MSNLAPTVTRAPRETTSPKPSFSEVQGWFENQTPLAYGDRPVTVLEALELHSPLHPFAWSSLGKQMLFGVPYVRVSETEWVDARLLSVRLTQESAP